MRLRPQPPSHPPPPRRPPASRGSSPRSFPAGRRRSPNPAPAHVWRQGGQSAGSPWRCPSRRPRGTRGGPPPSTSQASGARPEGLPGGPSRKSPSCKRRELLGKPVRLSKGTTPPGQSRPPAPTAGPAPSPKGSGNQPAGGPVRKRTVLPPKKNEVAGGATQTERRLRGTEGWPVRRKVPGSEIGNHPGGRRCPDAGRVSPPPRPDSAAGTDRSPGTTRRFPPRGRAFPRARGRGNHAQ